MYLFACQIHSGVKIFKNYCSIAIILISKNWNNTNFQEDSEEKVFRKHPKCTENQHCWNIFWNGFISFTLFFFSEKETRKHQNNRKYTCFLLLIFLIVLRKCSRYICDSTVHYIFSFYTEIVLIVFDIVWSICIFAISVIQSLQVLFV